MAMLRSITSSKVVPYAVRAISSRGGALKNAFNGCVRNSIIPFAISHQYLCTDAKKQRDTKLAKIIKSEIKLKEKSLGGTDMPAIPDDIPFALEDSPWEDHVTLSRDFDGEKIKVDVSIPCWCLRDDDEVKSNKDESNKDSDDDSDSDSDITDSDDEDENEEKKKPPQKKLYLTVKVTKENGITSEFDIIAFADGTIRVQYYDILKKSAPESTQQLQKSMTFYVDEGCKMEKALTEFLKVRGIEKSNYEFLFQYLIKKHKNKPVVTLKEFMNFIGE